MDTKAILENVRFCYVHTWEKFAFSPEQEAQYSACILIPKKNRKAVERIKAALEAATEIGRVNKWKNKVPANLTSPLRDGDAEKPDDPAYEGMYFINARNKTQPGVVYENGEKVINPDEFFSGCWGHASITFFPYDTAGNKGIGCGLNHIMVTENDEELFLGGRSTAEADFKDLIKSRANSII